MEHNNGNEDHNSSGWMLGPAEALHRYRLSRSSEQFPGKQPKTSLPWFCRDLRPELPFQQPRSPQWGTGPRSAPRLQLMVVGLQRLHRGQYIIYTVCVCIYRYIYRYDILPSWTPPTLVSL